MNEHHSRRPAQQGNDGQEPAAEAMSWFDRGPRAYDESEQPTRQLPTVPPAPAAPVSPPATPGPQSGAPVPPPYSAASQPRDRHAGSADEPTREHPLPPHDEPTREHPLPPHDADATVLMPSLRNAPQAPPTPIPELKFNAADATMVMSAVPYFTPSATPAYTGTIYVSYAASRAQMEDEAAAKPEAEREGAAASVARSGAIMALGSIVSRFSGFLRIMTLAAALGAAGVGDTYATANAVPSMVYELLLGGILTSVLVPLLVRSREHDPDRGQAFTQRLLSLTVIVLGAAAALAVAAAPLVPAVMASANHGPADRQLMASLAYLLLPAVFFFGLAGVLQAVLNSRGHFAAPMWTPILNNVVVISAAATFMLISDQVTLRPDNMTGPQIAVLGIGTTLGIATQACGLVPALRSVGFRWRWRFDFRQLGLSELGRLAGWMACYVAVSQIGVIVIIRLAYAAGAADAAGAFIYNNAFLLFMMAHGIVAVSIITALMPRMSAAAANQRYSEVARNLSLGTRLTSVVLVPVTAAYLVLGGPIASVLFQWGRYSENQARALALVVAVAGLGLVPFAISQLQTFAFYALTETKAAALVNVPVVATKIAVDVTIFYTVDAKYVTAGLMAGNLCSYVLGAGISATMLRRRLGPMGLGALFGALVRLAVAGAAGAGACLGVLYLLDPMLGEGKVSDIVRVLGGGLVLVAVYLGVAWLARVREISDVLEMVNRKFGGRLPLARGARNEPSADVDAPTAAEPAHQPGPQDLQDSQAPQDSQGPQGSYPQGVVHSGEPAPRPQTELSRPRPRPRPRPEAAPYRDESGRRDQPGHREQPDPREQPGRWEHPGHREGSGRWEEQDNPRRQ